MDYQSRFSITLTDIRKGDDMGFLTVLEQHLTVHVHEMMNAISADQQLIEASLECYFKQHNDCAFYLRGDRSAQAHINDVAWHFYSWVDGIGEVPSGVELIAEDVFVNKLLRKRKGDKDYFYPKHEFLHNWLKDYGDYSIAEADACIEYLEAQDRIDFNAVFSELAQAQTDISLAPDSAKPSGSASNVISLDAYRKK